MTNIKNEKEEELQPKRQPSFKRGLGVLATVGVGFGIYGYVRGASRGYNAGYKRGRIDGEVYANDQFRDLAKHMISTIKESKEE